ncbi:MAG: hypothetical protein ACON5H_12830 [Akkermansiaceae bacterium]
MIPTPMNTTNLLLATTSLLILVAFVLSLGNFKRDSGSDEAREAYEKLRIELAELRRETQIIEEMRRAAIYQAPIVPSPSPVVEAAAPETSALSQEQEDEIKRLKEQLAEQEVESEKEKKKADLYQKEALHFMGEKTREAQREERKQNRIRIALKMGTVTMVNTEYGFLSFSPDNQMTFQPGDVLGIRRNSGVLGRVRVSRQEGDQYVADIQPNAYATTGLPEVREGDDLIKLPEHYSKPSE